jgi:adenylate cyclase
VSPADRPDVSEAAQAADVDIPSLLEGVETAILGGPRRYTPAEVSERAGLGRDEARGLWRALGFPMVGDDEVMFNDADVEALREMRTLAEFGFADESLRLAVARLFGQTFSRLASYQGQLLLEEIARHPELLSSGDRLVELVDEVTPRLERLQGYAWRRQLAAYLARMAAQGPNEFGPATAPVAIGFADMSGFTSLTRKATEMELRELLDCFESMATEVVGDHGGRIVKTIGDEVLFQVDDPAEAALVALELLERAEADDRLPELRAGLAFGPVVSRLGDVYGSTVNIASRLTSISRPGWILIDRELHDQLVGDDRFHLKSRRPESVRGFSHLHPWRLRRAER